MARKSAGRLRRRLRPDCSTSEPYVTLQEAVNECLRDGRRTSGTCKEDHWSASNIDRLIRCLYLCNPSANGGSRVMESLGPRDTLRGRHGSAGKARYASFLPNCPHFRVSRVHMAYHLKLIFAFHCPARPSQPIHVSRLPHHKVI
jgi:hypothetical protein